MNPPALFLWGLLVWLATSLHECNGAAFNKGRLCSQSETGSGSLPQTLAPGHQDSASGMSEPGCVVIKNADTEDVEHIPIVQTQETKSREQSFTNIEENSPKPAEDLEYPEQEFVEDGIEEVDENGIIRGKYVYLEEDGVPALIEYEAIPGVKFEVKKYQKGLGVVSLGFSKKSNNENSKSSPARLIEKDPEYEHASVIGRYGPKKLSRKTRTIHEKKQNIQMDPTDEYDMETENINKQEENQEYPVDASYKFGFSADGQTRDEEADAQGNVQGSYSYVGEDGILTRVEYEAGSGKGFVIKKMTQEDTRRSLEAPKPQESMSLDQSVELQSTVSSPQIPSDQNIPSEDHRIQTSSKKAPTVVNKEQNDEEEETGNEEKTTSINQSNDGSYSFSYETPSQLREESVDSSGHLKSRFSFYIPGNGKIKQALHEGALKQDFALPSMYPVQTPPILIAPVSSNYPNARQMYNDDFSSLSYTLTPQHHHTEVSTIKQVSNVSPPKDEVITKQESENISGAQDDSTENLQDGTKSLGNTSPIRNDGSYSYTYETEDQMRQEARDTDGTVQGQYSYMGDDGIRRTVNYKASPEAGFTAEGSHLPSIENAHEESEVSYGEEVKSTSGDLVAPMKAFVPDPVSHNENPTTAEYTSSKSGDVNLQNMVSSSKNVLHEGINSYSTDKISSSTNLGIIPIQSSDSPQVFLDISGIRRAVATSDRGQVQKLKKVVRKRPIDSLPTSVNTPSDGSYSFEYNNDDQLRKESVDTKGNVYSSYQYKTKDGGRTAVVFVRKSLKDSENENNGNILQKQEKRNIPMHYVNEDMKYQSNNHHHSGGRNWVNRKRHVHAPSGTGVNQYNPVTQQVSQDRSYVRTSPQNRYMFENRPSMLNAEESAQTKNYYRKAKSIIRPFRGNAKFRRQIN